MTQPRVTIIGGGLAGCEAAWQVAQRGVRVDLYEMKPLRFSPAHESELLAELVCSNSLRSNDPASAVGLLKEEMRRLGSLIVQAADATAVPAGKALAVDRGRFAGRVTESILAHPLINLVREEVRSLPPEGEYPVILATGPLTAGGLAESLARLAGSRNLAFYDAIAPIVAAESLNMDIVYRKSRWDDGPGDYLNCPLNESQYSEFLLLLGGAARVPLKDFEDPKYFEGCLPIEVMLERGEQTLRFGPMKPVGLPDPRTGRTPYAVVQLRAENLERTLYNMVGFQTKLTYPEQKRVFRTIPGLEEAEFVRLGSIHRNTFVCAPLVLEPTLQLKKRPKLLLAGQLTGVEGYVESTAMGLLAGINAARTVLGGKPLVPPPVTAHGALIRHLTATQPDCFQPSNVNFGLFPPLSGKTRKRDRGIIRARLALEPLASWERDIG
ncbi:MAG TPA: methylenetetrahydrofolate--tRNA-(uracil(54)-C(5))-methyltransferase (FADH(2)-oxidizing) TrmFO [Desulfobacteraceae bacterium]|nr:methylenetetrahydrofolate--tRNA-(uracil(54)-C(5))-methyltransferase (FADH(2)-oxidizing) TrmFO [Desulfobacteraceae bacterium]